MKLLTIWSCSRPSRCASACAAPPIAVDLAVAARLPMRVRYWAFVRSPASTPPGNRAVPSAMSFGTRSARPQGAPRT